MDEHRSRWLATKIVARNDYEWDAAVSVLAAYMGVTGEWTHDLFLEPMAGPGRLIFPAGPTHYWWPE